MQLYGAVTRAPCFHLRLHCACSENGIIGAPKDTKRFIAYRLDDAPPVALGHVGHRQQAPVDDHAGGSIAQRVVELRAVRDVSEQDRHALVRRFRLRIPLAGFVAGHPISMPPVSANNTHARARTAIYASSLSAGASIFHGSHASKSMRPWYKRRG